MKPTLLLLAGLCSGQDLAPEIALVPAPQKLEVLDAERFVVSGDPTIAINVEGIRPQAEAFADYWWRMTGTRPVVEVGTEGDFVLEMIPNDSSEHVIRIEDGAKITGPNRQEITQGAATLLQMAELTPAGWSLPRVAIHDWPESEFRSVMVDVARQPHSTAVLEDVIDLMYLYKVRYLHLHLTDDQSFRFPFPPVTDALPNNETIPLEDWSALVVYARARGITIIPELDLPGHSSQLKRSGYLEDPTPEDPLTDADVAHPVNFERIYAIIDAMLNTFELSPYFHIGGDESGAGRSLIPFLVAVNKRLSSRFYPTRLMVWEGFHGVPEGLPATGENRVVVFSWESSYNPPWALLDAGYEVVNASWKPMYVVGGGSYRHPHIGGRYWDPLEIHAWNKNEFWHWQPGTPVFEDRGPQDDDRGDGIWRAPQEQHSQILGGQLLFWEQRQETVLTEAFDRVAAMSDSLWNDEPDPVGFLRRHEAVRERVRSIVQPVQVMVQGDFDPDHPTNRDHLWFQGSVRVTCSSVLDGEIRFTRDGSIPGTESEKYTDAFEIAENAKLVAQLFVDGEAVGAPARINLDNSPAKVWVEWFDLPRRSLGHVPDFSERTPSSIGLLPELRGPYKTTVPMGQKMEATFVAKEAGEHEFRLQSRDGRAKFYLNGEFLLGPSDPSEVHLFAKRTLEAGKHLVRVDHASGNISPTVIVAVKALSDERFVNLTTRLAEIPRGTEPEAVVALDEEVDLLTEGLKGWSFLSNSGVPLEDVVSLDKSVLHIAGRPSGYLQTKRWYRDYEFELEWRWPDKPGNGGVLVHTTTPLLFYGWPRSLEVQLMNSRAGDFWTIGEGVDLLVENAAERRTPRRPGNLHAHRRIPRLRDDVENPVGDWNRMRIVCRGAEIVVYVNGVEVNRGMDCTETEGAISLQSEGAAVEFRNLKVRPLEFIAR